ncbi:MAG: two-component system response regulator [Candidatus Kerfeldbacteria bacterium CG08_land_8_20_14_0_20_42_7]|uniref:Two-component system response regulator n=1 Tax=Candidatus Kerfeldbacteria bacterium CG08_land_8_20_14_0_20_42_7 TaxID=2014245 RepID=A0A2H0YSH7_9BACT|nr:MAG: two-component system response regulator [Candidatus Kerfeldbacteria bacterium CG08_land_8_20_14_0_20_42_7]
MTKQRRVLIVEDEEPVRKIIRESLTSVGIMVDEAENGQIAIEKARTAHPDVVILDYLMPKMHGIEFVQLLRQESWGKNVAVIVLTNLPDEPHLVEMEKQRTCRILSKAQASMQDIIEAVKQSL